MRQIGLIQLLAKIGSWVPARSARIGIADRTFTRVDAVEDLASGQSNFMGEWPKPPTSISKLRNAPKC